MNIINFKLHQMFNSFYIDYPKLFNSLIDPLNPVDVKKYLKTHHVYSEELVALYSTYNGNFPKKNECDSCYFFGFGYFLSLEYSIKLYELDEDFKDWKKIPIFATLDGDYILYDFTQKENGGLFLFSPALLINQPELIYDNLISFCETIEKCYNSRAYTVIDNKLIINYELESQISRELNQKSSYWD